ncbi:hypothetical protein BKE38_24240 [Pseudoroseomonas deserti]|uniref:Arylsulfatase n=1 Tax=Teichococcus deserti TaxID=1817963 RepID=A0A1V2GWG1_9PROT|nr:aspartate/glutamate racemase family protein [Pseudoroseomonas deserti]ONG47270.1 hypothetical protein BKE38_24240 [Pseudoroseomonas deserti]
MRRIAVISVTLNAVTPMMRRFSQEPGAWAVTNLLDEALQAEIAAEGRVTDRSMAQMGALLGRAAAIKAEAVLLTCTVFSPYLPALRQLFAMPLIGADVAMLEQAAALQRRTVILCTFPAALAGSAAMFEAASGGVAADVVLVEGAQAAMAAGDPARHDALITEAIRAHAQNYEAVVLAQMSMAGAAALVPDCPVPLLTSPDCAVAALRTALPA